MTLLISRMIDYFVTRTKIVNLISIIIVAAGIWALFGMKRDLHPLFKFNFISVSLSYPSGSASEIERLIAYPIEEALQDMSDVEEMTSRSRVGVASVTLKFPQSVKNLNEKIEEIRSRVQGVLRHLPEGVRDLNVSQAGDNQIFLASIGVKGIDEKNWSHHQFLVNLKNRLGSINGITNVESTLRPYHIYIRFNQQKLENSGVSLLQIRQVVRSTLDSQVIGFNSVNGRDWLLEFEQKSLDLDRIKNIPLFQNSSGLGLKLKDVAQIEFDIEKNGKYQFLLNGQEAVEMTVFKSEQRDAMKAFDDVKKILSDINLPKDVSTEVLYDGPYFIQQQIDVLLSNGFGGLILVLVMLAFAMGWKTSLMTAIGLPISYFGTFVILKYFNISIDLISLIAMILVVGNLVDDAVIFAERYNQLLSEGIEPKLAASAAAKELIVPVTGTIATIICAFIPIIVIDSELSVIFFAIPIVVAAALLLSWFETFFILPNHLQHYVTKPEGEKGVVFFYWLSRGYRKILKHILNWRYLYGLASVALLVFSLIIAGKMPQDFSLSINAPQVEVFVTFKDELNFDQVKSELKPIHDQFLQIPNSKLDFIETNLGWVWRDGKSYRGPKYATIRLVLNRKVTDTKNLRDDVQKKVDEILADFKSEKIAEITAKATVRGSNDRRSNLTTVEIKGRDENAFRLAESEIIKAIVDSKKVQEFVVKDDLGPQKYSFSVIPEALSRFSLSREELAYQVQAQTGSVEILQTRDSGRWLNIYVEPLAFKEPNINSLNQLTLQSPQHRENFSIRQIGKWMATGFSESVAHKDGRRVLNLDFRFDGEKTNEPVVKKELEAVISPIVKKYSNLEIKMIDSNEQDKQGRDWTGKIVLFAGLMIYLILALTLRSWSQPLIVGLPIPFALIGVVWALKAHQLPLSLMTMIGLIGTMGVAVNDSIVMVYHINGLFKKRRENLDLNYEQSSSNEISELIINGASSRLRAIFLTASCTLIGVFPTAYGIGGESGFTQPLAFSLGWGLLTSLFLTLFIIPAMLLIYEDIDKVWFKIKNRKNRNLLKTNELSKQDHEKINSVNTSQNNQL